LDHYSQGVHEAKCGRSSWQPTIKGLFWLARNSFWVDVAGRSFTTETQVEPRAGCARLFADLGIAIDAHDHVRLMLFPEMDPNRDVSEITITCWDILHKLPDEVMFALAP
jgi:hypothetical protein